MLKMRGDNSPMVYLPVEKRRRVYEAIDEGLSKYLPKYKNKNFSNLIQMVEKLMNSKENNRDILEKIDLPPGKSYVEELVKEAQENHKLIMEEKLYSMRKAEQEEKEIKKKESDAKEIFINRMNTNNIKIEEIQKTN